MVTLHHLPIIKPSVSGLIETLASFRKDAEESVIGQRSARRNASLISDHSDPYNCCFYCSVTHVTRCWKTNVAQFSSSCPKSKDNIFSIYNSYVSLNYLISGQYFGYFLLNFVTKTLKITNLVTLSATHVTSQVTLSATQLFQPKSVPTKR